MVENPNQILRLFYQSLHFLSTENGGNFGEQKKRTEFKTNKYGTSGDRKNRLAALSLYSLYVTGWKGKGMDTRVSLKQALKSLGFQGGNKHDTELNQWINHEKELLADR